jgi:SOCS box
MGKFGQFRLSNFRKIQYFIFVGQVELLLLHGAAFVLQRENNINLDKSVPHYIIEHLLMECDRSATALNLLHLYRESGGAMWLLQLYKKENANALEYLLQEKPEWRKEASVLEAMMQQPRSLMSFCRSSIKRTVGRNFWRDTSGLGLPRELTSYLTSWNYAEEFWREYRVRLADVANLAGSSH